MKRHLNILGLLLGLLLVAMVSHVAIADWSIAPKGEVPQSARDVAGKVKSNMGQPPDGHVGGRVFKNAEGKLPQGGAYREYDVHPYTGANRGAERVVIDTKTGKAYYTNDHYQTFTEVPE